MATISVAGLYLYDSTIFDDLSLPDGISKDDLITNLLTETAELETVIPNPDIFKEVLGAWSRRMRPIWDKLYTTTTLTYNPIYNYDRTEEYTDGETTDTNGTSNTAQTLDSKTEHSVVGFNETSAALADTNSTSGSPKTDTTVSNKQTRNLEHKARMYGNIGVTTTQQMLEAERNVDRFDIYAEIINDFKKRFCLEVY